MADADSQYPSKPQTPIDPPVPVNINNPRKQNYYYTSFMYKAALVTVFLVLLPLSPSIAPEFINQTLHARSWELLQLILVGIAVSYGLFSKKNGDGVAEKPDHTHKPDLLSYASKLLQVSSVFDDEDEENEPDHESQTIIEENHKVLQTLINSQQCYNKGQPVVVVAGNIIDACEFTQKPLLLPVRSLKQTSKGEEYALRSPIPWRSRSGRAEMMIDESTAPESGGDTGDVAPLPPRRPVLSTSTSNATKEELVEKAMMESTSDDEEEGDYFGGVKSPGNNNNNNNNNNGVDDDGDVGPDVDKKADEFIARFREQIRLQRIESIRRTTAQRKTSRSN